jgi:chromosome segregation protein
MYLKSIKAVGFKSFADKIDLELNEGITAVVGPNGSGKSNIVDAIRWVLGEQSIKSLRGSDVMSDVIFSGSSSREAQKRASVNLVFDNKDHYLNSEFDEIEVKRTVYKTGENEYYINNTKVRLKDITDLFMDTGAGLNSFNIISQGNITDIVSSKPEGRRIIFESAAGVLKYKKRKEEALRKLDNTKENLLRVKLLIDELEKTVTPLKDQSEKAKKYLNFKSSLEGVEIALLAQDITSLNEQYKEINNKINSLEKSSLDLSHLNNGPKIEKLQLENIKFEEQINEINNKIININEDLAKLASEKQVTLERQKYGVSKDLINESLIKSKEEELDLEKDVNIVSSEVDDIQDKKNKKERELSQISDDLLKIKIKRSNLSNDLNNQNKNLFIYQNRKEILQSNILNDEKLPSSVRNVLNNIRLKGIHNTIGNLIEIPDLYETAINVALGSSSNFIVVDNFKCATEAVNYLKEERLGRATFFPIETIKSRYLANVIINDLKKENCFIGVASDLIKFGEQYRNIIENQLGNILVVKGVKDLNVLGAKLDYKYRIVSLDGEILHAGGSLTGGFNRENNISSKNELKKVIDNIENIQKNINDLNKEIDKLNLEFSNLSEKEENLNKDIILIKENLNNKMLKQNVLKVSLSEKKAEINGAKDILNNKLDSELIKILEDFTKKSEEKTILEQKLNNIKTERIELNNYLNELQKEEKEQNTAYNKIQNELKDSEVIKGKLDVKLDNLLLNLSENYNLTYEAAMEKYSLDLDETIAREKVKDLKRNLDLLGEVNLGAIDEYDRLSKRYDFLNSQENDLEKASNELMDIIGEMDDIMIDKFKTSFDAISKEFKSVFKTIFQGGKGELKLTNPDDLLNTGIDIIAEPPGKKINSTIALSGGEQSLTAICLLFAILNVRPVPFIVLDEAEAALDEANVEMFGKYISDKKKDSQFILITHKKKMMEYADVLYGITMQESGVSKIVSAKLV